MLLLLPAAWRAAYSVERFLSLHTECRSALPATCCLSHPAACYPSHPAMHSIRFLSSVVLRILPRADLRFLPSASFRFLSSASTTMLRALFLRDAGGLSFRSATQRTGVACSIHIGAPDLHAAGLHALDMHAVGCSVVGEAHSTRAGAADRTWSAVNHRALDGESTRPPGTGSPNLSPQAACRACVRRGRHRAPALHG